MGVHTEIRSPMRLIVRCFAELKDGQWQAFSLEFGLAAQGDSQRAVKEKIESMIFSYIEDALVGEDREHAGDLLARRAHWRVYAKYYLYVALAKGIALVNGNNRESGTHVFDEPVPLYPHYA